MPIYATGERKAVSSASIAVGGEVIEVAPYFTGTGYLDVGLRTNTTTSEHVSKLVEVSAGYSLEPVGKITYQKSTYSNAKQAKLELATITTGLAVNLFANQFNLIGNFNFPLAVLINTTLFVGYSNLFSKSIMGMVSNTGNTYWYVCSPDFSTRTQIHTNDSSIKNIRHLCETTSTLLVADIFSNYLTSTNGNSFVVRVLPVHIYGIASNSSTFVFYARSGVIYTSTDGGVTLVNRGVQGGEYIDGAVAFGNNIFAIISNTSTAKTSGDNGVTWVSKTLPETIAWDTVIFDPTHNVFILAALSKSYFYVTVNFDLFTKIDLPYTLPLDGIRIGKIGDITVISKDVPSPITYISKDLKAWIKLNISNLYLNAVNNPPIYNLGDAVGANVKTYELRSDLFYSPPNPTNISNVNAFVRTALD